MPDSHSQPQSFPRVSDYVVEPETNTELFDGEVRKCLPANPNHSRQHAQLILLLSAYCAPGYVVDVDLLTRQAHDNNFASDSCIRKDGFDPETGDRYLEELAFEIKATQRPGDLTKRARIMAKRGVRRVFAIPVKGDAAGYRLVAGPLMEWQAKSDSWRIYDGNEIIEDACLRHPLKAAALIDVIEADRALGNALIASGNVAVVEHVERRYQDGKADGIEQGIEQGLREALLTMLRMRDIDVDVDVQNRIQLCPDPARLRLWLERSAHARTLRDVFADT